MSIDCKEFENRIPGFLDDKLNNRQAKEFFAHMEDCEECKEELRIQFLVAEGTLRLEDGDSFDLNKELDLKIEHTKKNLRIRRRVNILIYIMEAVALAAVMFILILVYISR